MEPKPYPFTPYLQASVAAAALLIGASALVASFSVWTSDKNARLVEIGVGVLRADPKKEPTALAARKWALDLIDANAGGVKFSAEARAELLEKALSFDDTWIDVGGYEPADATSKRPSKDPASPKNSN